MDEDMRTVWCGNLSEKVTEEILYELFLQGGPVQRVSIPKDRDGKQRAYGFVTYKHINSVKYALNLFHGTVLFNRPLSMGPRKNVELPQITQSQDHAIDLNYRLQLGQQMVLGSDMSHLRIDPFGISMLPSTNSYMKQTLSHKDDRRSRRVHPYHREQNKSNNHHKDHRSRDSHNNHRTNYYSRHDCKSNNRHNYR
ncbi:Putative RNA-binding protein 11 [Habropoda laboriosa]|uniref:Putative RNA-binding protein 11 n=1 Tax=Habropoda laboriosa TaxID=597456 RepID=A0A0L7QKR7_9HYME|nr:PREDICTED: splicing regulator RBM11 [Habropoda laboriosa]KOC59202.1 Putative RNA-binding protein 11 [Habropoda laboriosa]